MVHSSKKMWASISSNSFYSFSHRLYLLFACHMQISQSIHHSTEKVLLIFPIKITNYFKCRLSIWHFIFISAPFLAVVSSLGCYSFLVCVFFLHQLCVDFVFPPNKQQEQQKPEIRLSIKFNVLFLKPFIDLWEKNQRFSNSKNGLKKLPKIARALVLIWNKLIGKWIGSK